MKRRLASYIGMVIIGFAIWIWWNTSGQGDCNPMMALGACSLFDTGILAAIGQTGGFLLACLVGTTGWGLLKWGISDPKIDAPKKEENEVS